MKFNFCIYPLIEASISNSEYFITRIDISAKTLNEKNNNKLNISKHHHDYHRNKHDSTIPILKIVGNQMLYNVNLLLRNYGRIICKELKILENKISPSTPSISKNATISHQSKLNLKKEIIFKLTIKRKNSIKNKTKWKKTRKALNAFLSLLTDKLKRKRKHFKEMKETKRRNERNDKKEKGKIFKIYNCQTDEITNENYKILSIDYQITPQDTDLINRINKNHFNTKIEFPISINSNEKSISSPFSLSLFSNISTPRPFKNYSIINPILQSLLNIKILRAVLKGQDYNYNYNYNHSSYNHSNFNYNHDNSKDTITNNHPLLISCNSKMILTRLLSDYFEMIKINTSNNNWIPYFFKSPSPSLYSSNNLHLHLSTLPWTNYLYKMKLSNIFNPQILLINLLNLLQEEWTSNNQQVELFSKIFLGEKFIYSVDHEDHYNISNPLPINPLIFKEPKDKIEKEANAINLGNGNEINHNQKNVRNHNQKNNQNGNIQNQLNEYLKGTLVSQSNQSFQSNQISNLNSVNSDPIWSCKYCDNNKLVNVHYHQVIFNTLPNILILFPSPSQSKHQLNISSKMEFSIKISNCTFKLSSIIFNLRENRKNLDKNNGNGNGDHNDSHEIDDKRFGTIVIKSESIYYLCIDRKVKRIKLAQLKSFIPCILIYEYFN